jgi:hypothetical protein
VPPKRADPGRFDGRSRLVLRPVGVVAHRSGA